MPNPLQLLQAEGQSVWCDYISRGSLTSGAFQRLIDEYAVTGVTANPTIFEKAIGGSADYDEAITKLARQSMDPTFVYETLATEDVRRAADSLRPIYDRTSGADGFVSLEVSPELAHDTAGTIAEAKRLWREVDRPNLMIKVPGTDEGAPAVEELIADGLNINITLLFSVDAHRRVMDAYMAGLERRIRAGHPIDRSASVASFFVSRVDTLVDKLLDAKLGEAEAGSQKELLQQLRGKAAIANAKIAYRSFQETFATDRFASLKAKGARLQRPLWASTSTKDPAYRDVVYVEELIGPETVNTMPQQTLDAFKDHGHVSRTVDKDLDKAQEVMTQLRQVGIDMDEVTATLLDEGIRAFADSFAQLGAEITQKLGRMSAESAA